MFTYLKPGIRERLVSENKLFESILTETDLRLTVLGRQGSTSSTCLAQFHCHLREVTSNQRLSGMRPFAQPNWLKLKILHRTS